MKLSVAVLSSILFVCSVTIANPVVPSTTASTEHVSSTVVPSSTTSTESNPSATPNTNGLDLSRHDSLSANMKNLLENYSKGQQDCSRQEEECKFINLKVGNQESLISHFRKKIDDLQRKFYKNGRDNSKYKNEMEQLKRELQDGYSKYTKLENMYKDCIFKHIHSTRQLELFKVNLVKSVFGASFNIELLEEQLSLILSHSLVKQYLEGLCSGEQSSACRNDFGQDPDAEQQQQDPDAGQES
ncbi:hypothetical protein QVD99_006172 [Batrachochytrium dendrobatidis]|nr:hypothetical protein QVD99_006172 [Batrachochytrium dendrobatidis]